MGLEEPLAFSAVAAVPRIIMTATIAAVAPAARYQRVFDFGAIGSAERDRALHSDRRECVLPPSTNKGAFLTMW